MSISENLSILFVGADKCLLKLMIHHVVGGWDEKKKEK